jgi:hypothetical protein
MSTPLSEAEQDEIFHSKIALSLDNFSLAWRVADLLIEYAEAGLPPPRATIRFLGGARSVEVVGANCGLFTTLVMQMAVLDTRRTIEFFGIARDSKRNEFKPMTKRQDDDLGIEHFGLAVVSPQRLLDTVTAAVGAPAQPLLLDMHRWSSKHLAHFTVSDASVTLQTIRDCSKGMIEAYLVLLFDALSRQRPRIQPIESEDDNREA